MLSAHFTEEEFDIPFDSRIKANAQFLAQMMEGIRSHFGLPVRVHSSYRSPVHNVAAGGKQTSFHLYTGDQCAIDFDIPNLGITFVFNEIRNGKCKNDWIDKIILEYDAENISPRCIHIQAFTDISKARHLAYIGNTGAGVKYTPTEFTLSL